MIIKRLFSALCALAVCVGCAGAKKVECKSASGILDPLGYRLDLNIAYNADGYYAGNFTFDEKTYIAFGRTYDVDDPEISLQLFENGCLVGDLNVMYEEDMDRCAGTFNQEDGNRFDIEMRTKSGATMEDPFEHPSFDSFGRYNIYHFQVESADYFFAKSMILVKDRNGFAFYLSGTGVNGYGSVQNFNTESWTVVPYKDGKITFKDAYDDTFVIEFYKDFIIAKCLEAEAVEDYESDAAFASGVFMYTESTGTFNESWLSQGGEGDWSDMPGSALTNYWPSGNYPDVEDLRNHIKAYDMDDLRIPVDLGGADRTNILSYFRAIAKSFNKGILGKALRAADGKAAAGVQWTLDTRNGYCKCIVPDKTGKEGMEMCFWRGRDGKDVVALNLQYIGLNPNDESDMRMQYLGVFFQYNPANKTLMPVSTNGNNTFSLFQCTELYGIFPDDAEDIDSMKLPREGKTIEFLTSDGVVKHALQWNAEAQWFDWTK